MTTHTLATLNRLLVALSRSLPMYLEYAVPWMRRGNEASGEIVSSIAMDQQEMIDRIGSWIIDEGGTVYPGEFPMAFTALHDVSLDFLIKKLIEEHKQLIAEIGRYSDALQMAPSAQSLAEEALGMAKGHLDLLEELAVQPSEAVR